MNAANEKVNAVANVLTGEEDAVPATARYYKSKGLPWVVIGELSLLRLGIVCAPSSDLQLSTWLNRGI